jgi:hypothetical protein
VVLVKKVIPTWLSGMKLRGLLRGHSMGSGNGHLVLSSLTQPETVSWLPGMNFLLNSGTWIAPTYLLQQIVMADCQLVLFFVLLSALPILKTFFLNILLLIICRQALV